MRGRIYSLIFGLGVVWVLLLLKAALIQVLPNQRLSELKKRQFETRLQLTPKRGDVLDRENRELASSVLSYSLFADPKLIHRPRAVAKRIGRVLGKSPQNLYAKMKDSEKRFIWLDRHLSQAVRNQIQKLEIKGLGFVEEPKRIYPNTSLASHILGFVGSEGNGLEGLESKFDEYLQGEMKRIGMQRDARGRPLIRDGQVFSERPDGATVKLTLDLDLQYTLEKELERAVKEHEAEAAMGVVMRAQTSEVLAMASLPNFDSNRPFDVSGAQRRNRAITDPIEPGSVFKTLTVAAGLRSGKYSPNSQINCENGHFQIGKRIVREADAKHNFGVLTVNEVLQKSSNIGTSKISLSIGAEKMREMMVDFGIGERTGIELKGESRGILPKLPWTDHQTATISFGHGVAATPLQIASVYATIANGGVYKKPYLVQSISTSDLGEVFHYQPEEERRVLTKEEASRLTLMLVNSTGLEGTGRAATVEGFPVAGKTGTAQKAELEKRGYRKGSYMSSFAGFIPAQNPEFVIYVVVDNPQKGYYGAEVAAPIFSRVGARAVRKAGLRPAVIPQQRLLTIRNPFDVAPENLKPPKIDLQQVALQELSKGDPTTVPELTGLSVREVIARMQAEKKDFEFVGRGVVSKTIPAAGSPWPSENSRGSKLRIILK